MPRGIYSRKAIKPFVVYVRFPSNSKEYAYLCKLPNIHQGSTVIANGTPVQVLRTAAYDPIATRYVGSVEDRDRIERRKAICQQLNMLVEQEELMERYKKLKSPDARKLLNELKGLI